VLIPAFLRFEGEGIIFEPLRKLVLKPVTPLGANTEVAPGLAMNPGTHVDPARDLIRSLSVPRNILAEVAVRFG